MVCQAIAGGLAFARAGLAPAFEGAIGRRGSGSAESGPMDQEPEDGEGGGVLVGEDLGDVSFDIGAGEAQRNAVAGRDLRRIGLRGASFEGTILAGADLREADLSDVTFLGAVLDGVRAKGAVLKKAALLRCSAKNGDFSGAGAGCQMAGTLSQIPIAQ